MVSDFSSVIYCHTYMVWVWVLWIRCSGKDTGTWRHFGMLLVFFMWSPLVRRHLFDLLRSILHTIVNWHTNIPRPLPAKQHRAPMPCTDAMHGATSPLSKCMGWPHLTEPYPNYMILLLLLPLIKTWIKCPVFKWLTQVSQGPAGFHLITFRSWGERLAVWATVIQIGW